MWNTRPHSHKLLALHSHAARLTDSLGSIGKLSERNQRFALQPYTQPVARHAKRKESSAFVLAGMLTDPAMNEICCETNWSNFSNNLT